MRLLAAVAAPSRRVKPRNRREPSPSARSTGERGPGENSKESSAPKLRFDGIAGCLRTPAGGSSRQTILVVEDGQVRSRLLSPREAARLMGLARRLPAAPGRYNKDAYHVCGDGVSPPVVRHLAAHLIEPILAGAKRAQAAAE